MADIKGGATKDYKVSASDPFLNRDRKAMYMPHTTKKETAAPVVTSGATGLVDIKPIQPVVLLNSPCCVCNKKVGHGKDRRTACNKIWHSSCFTCGGLSEDGCKKVMNMGAFITHHNQPFCVPCYAKSPKDFIPVMKAAPVVVVSAAAPAVVAVPEPEPEEEEPEEDPEPVAVHPLEYIPDAFNADGNRILESLSVEEVKKLVDSIDLTKFSPLFVANDITGKVLCEIASADELLECGVKMPGPITRAFLKFIEEAKNSGVPPSTIA